MTTISNWLVRAVREAYSVAGVNIPPSNVKAHDVRAMSASLAALRNVAMKNIPKSAQWKSDSTFISFYLKDLSHCADGLFKLGPLVAAQQLTKP